MTHFIKIFFTSIFSFFFPIGTAQHSILVDQIATHAKVWRSKRKMFELTAYQITLEKKNLNILTVSQLLHLMDPLFPQFR